MPGWKKQLSFGQRLRRRMNSESWTARTLAAEVGCSEGYLGRILRGEQEPTWSLVVAIAEALGESLDKLAVRRWTPGRF